MRLAVPGWLSHSIRIALQPYTEACSNITLHCVAFLNACTPKDPTSGFPDTPLPPPRLPQSRKLGHTTSATSTTTTSWRLLPSPHPRLARPGGSSVRFGAVPLREQKARRKRSACFDLLRASCCLRCAWRQRGHIGRTGKWMNGWFACFAPAWRTARVQAHSHFPPNIPVCQRAIFCIFCGNATPKPSAPAHLAGSLEAHSRSHAQPCAISTCATCVSLSRAILTACVHNQCLCTTCLRCVLCGISVHSRRPVSAQTK